MRDKIVDVMPEMKTGKELLDCLRERPEYPACIWEKNSMERLVALSDIYNVYIPSRMSVEIYHKLYMGLLRSMQKKESMQDTGRPVQGDFRRLGLLHHPRSLRYRKEFCRIPGD